MEVLKCLPQAVPTLCQGDCALHTNTTLSDNQDLKKPMQCAALRCGWDKDKADKKRKQIQRQWRKPSCGSSPRTGWL